MYLGLVLFFITFVVLSLSKLLLAQMKKSEGHQIMTTARTPPERQDAGRDARGASFAGRKRDQRRSP